MGRHKDLRHRTTTFVGILWSSVDAVGVVEYNGRMVNAQQRAEAENRYQNSRIAEIMAALSRPKVQQRIWAKVDKTGGPDACWAWLGSMGSHGYGTFTVARKYQNAPHRLIWMMRFGEIPEDRIVLRTCSETWCCNPGHMFLDEHGSAIRKRKALGRCIHGAPSAAVCRRCKTEITAPPVTG